MGIESKDKKQIYLDVKNNKLKQWELAQKIFNLHELGEGRGEISLKLSTFSNLNKSKSWISKAINFYKKANHDLIRWVESEQISYSHGLLLVNLRIDYQKNLFQKIITNNISVGELEKILQGRKTKINSDQELKYVEDLFLKKGIKTKVTKTKIEINYSDIDHLNRILERLKLIEE